MSGGWLAQPKLVNVSKGTRLRPPPPLAAPAGLRRGSLRLHSRAKAGVPGGIRTRVTGVKGRRPGPLDDGDLMARAFHHNTASTGAGGSEISAAPERHVGRTHPRAPCYCARARLRVRT